jgi:hypothetical protein
MVDPERNLTIREIPDAHYRWIWRACRADPWRSRILAAIQKQREVDPLFAVPRPTWNNHDERHRTINHIGYHPVGQCSVSTVTGRASQSTTMYRKVDDAPGPLTSKHRSVRSVFTGCDGFRANFQGVRLEEYRQFSADCLRYGSTAVIHEDYYPPDNGLSVLRTLAEPVPTRRRLTSAEYWKKIAGKPPARSSPGGPSQPPPRSPQEWRVQLVENYPGQVAPSYDPHNTALLRYVENREKASWV